MPFVTVCCGLCGNFTVQRTVRTDNNYNWGEYYLDITQSVRREVGLVWATCSTFHPSGQPWSWVSLSRPPLSSRALGDRQDAPSGPEIKYFYHQTLWSVRLRLTFLDLSTSSVIALNISSTLMLSFAEVSNNRIPIWSANLLASSVKTTYNSQSYSLLTDFLTAVLHLSVRIIVLVAHQYPVDDVTVLIDLVQPSLYVGEAPPTGDVVDHDDPVCSPVVGAGDGPEPLLAGSVPDL